MPRAYDNDLRRKVLAACAAGKGTQRELAELFGVSLGWIEKIIRQQKQNGQAERIEQRHGPLSRVDARSEACLLASIADRPDRTLAELQRVLVEQRSVRIGISQMSSVLKRLNLRLKKSRSTPPNAIRKPTFASARSSWSASGRSRQNT